MGFFAVTLRHTRATVALASSSPFDQHWQQQIFAPRCVSRRRGQKGWTKQLKRYAYNIANPRKALLRDRYHTEDGHPPPTPSLFLEQVFGNFSVCPIKKSKVLNQHNFTFFFLSFRWEKRERRNRQSFGQNQSA